VAKPALGTKRICQACEAKFYDLDGNEAGGVPMLAELGEK